MIYIGNYSYIKISFKTLKKNVLKLILYNKRYELKGYKQIFLC